MQHPKEQPLSLLTDESPPAESLLPPEPQHQSEIGKVAWQSFKDLIHYLGCFHFRLNRYPIFGKVVGYHFKPNGHIRSFGFITLITEFDGEIFHNPSACIISMWNAMNMPQAKGHFYTDCFVVMNESDLESASLLDTKRDNIGIRLGDLVSLNVRRGTEPWTPQLVTRIPGRLPIVEMSCYIKNDRGKSAYKRRSEAALARASQQILVQTQTPEPPPLRKRKETFSDIECSGEYIQPKARVEMCSAISHAHLTSSSSTLDQANFTRASHPPHQDLAEPNEDPTSNMVAQKSSSLPTHPRSAVSRPMETCFTPVIYQTFPTPGQDFNSANDNTLAREKAPVYLQKPHAPANRGPSTTRTAAPQESAMNLSRGAGVREIKWVDDTSQFSHQQQQQQQMQQQPPPQLHDTHSAPKQPPPIIGLASRSYTESDEETLSEDAAL